MKHTFVKNWFALFTVALCVALGWAKQASGALPCPISFPTGNTLNGLVTQYPGYPNSPSTFTTVVQDTNEPLVEATYLTWCVDANTFIDPSQGFTVNATVFEGALFPDCDTNLNSELPSGHPASCYVSPAVWQQVNYILNHKNGAYFWEIQVAINDLVGGPPLGPSPPYPPFNPSVVQALLTDASNNAASWTPQCGNVVGVVWAITNEIGTPLTAPVQLIMLEVPVPCVPSIAVTEEVACLQPTNNCGTFGKSAEGFVVSSNFPPAFCYQVTVTNTGGLTLSNIAVTDTLLGNITAALFPSNDTLPPGGTATAYFKAAVATNLTNTVTAAGQATSSSSVTTNVLATNQATVIIDQAGITCNLTVTSPCDLDGKLDNNVLLPACSTNCVVTFNLQIVNTGLASLSNVTISSSALVVRGCGMPAPFILAAGATTNFSCSPILTCSNGSGLVPVSVTGNVMPDNNHCAIYDITSTNVLTASTSCSGSIECAPGLANLCGYVFLNCAGSNLTSGTGLAGLCVTLQGTNGVKVATTNSAANGAFCFSNLAPGSYVVVVTPPANYTETFPPGVTSSKVSVTLAACQSATVIFGYSDQNAPVFSAVPASTNLGCNPSSNMIPTGVGLVTAKDDRGPLPVSVTYTDVVSGCSGMRTITYTAAGACITVKTNQTIVWTVDTTPPMLTCPPGITITNPVQPYCTYTVQDYDAPCNGSNACSILTNCFKYIYSNGYVQCGLTNGGGYCCKFTAPSCVQTFLPCNGTPNCLKNSYVNPTTCEAGSFAADVLCLKLNIDCGDNKSVSGFAGGCGDLVVNDPTCALNGYSCRQILNICHTALGGGNISGYGCSINDLHTLCSNLNASFENCKPSTWCQSHLCPSTITNVPPSVSGTAKATDNCDPNPTVTYSDVITNGSCPDTYLIARTWKAIDHCGNVSTCTQMIHIGTCSALSLVCSGGAGQVGSNFMATLTVSGGVPPYAFSVISGKLPGGLMLNPKTGVISGTPTNAGTFDFVVQVQDAMGTIALSVCNAGCAPTSSTWNFNAPTGALGNSQAYTVNGVTITAYGFLNNGTPTALYGKNQGSTESGLGINGATDDEITPANFVQLDLTQVIASGAQAATILLSSVQSGESYNVYGSHTLGTLGTQLLAGGTSTSAFAMPGFPAYAYISVQANVANVLLGAVSAIAPAGCSITILPPPCSGSVCGYVFLDCNGDGFLTPGIDLGKSNIMVTLKNSNGSVIATNVTDGTGAYCFYNLAAGNYSVCIAQPTSCVQTAGCHTNHWVDSSYNDCWNENDGYKHWKGGDGVDRWVASDSCQHYKNSSGQDCWKDKYGYYHTQNCTYVSCNIPKNNCETFTLGACENKSCVNFAYQGTGATAVVCVTGPSYGVCGQTLTYNCTVTNTGTACFNNCQVSACGNNYPCPALSPGQSCSFQINYQCNWNDCGNFTCQATATCGYNNSGSCTSKGTCNTWVDWCWGW